MDAFNQVKYEMEFGIEQYLENIIRALQILQSIYLLRHILHKVKVIYDFF